jgi:hypothetical protein
LLATPTRTKSLAQSDELGRSFGRGRHLAGPGSGKTSTVTGRFVHLIRQGVDPARIAAVILRCRIVTLLELPSSSSLHVMAFYAFAFRQLSRSKGFQASWIVGPWGLIDGPATAQCPPPHPYGGSWRVFRPGGWLAHAGGTGRGGSGGPPVADLGVCCSSNPLPPAVP